MKNIKNIGWIILLAFMLYLPCFGLLCFCNRSGLAASRLQWNRMGVWMKKIIIVLLLSVAPAAAQTVEQRLGGTIGALIVENAKLISELEAAKQQIAKLQAEIDKAKVENNTAPVK